MTSFQYIQVKEELCLGAELRQGPSIRQLENRSLLHLGWSYRDAVPIRVRGLTCRYGINPISIGAGSNNV